MASPFWLFRAVKAAALGVMFCCAVYVVFVLGPWLETRFFPVVGKLTIERMEALPDGQTRIDAYFVKKRACDYIGIAWYRGQHAQDFERVALVLGRAEGDTSSPNRPVGAQRSGPWTVNIPMDEIESNSFVELSHRCHPFWTTTTEFYP